MSEVNEKTHVFCMSPGDHKTLWFAWGSTLNDNSAQDDGLLLGEVIDSVEDEKTQIEGDSDRLTVTNAATNTSIKTHRGLVYPVGTLGSIDVEVDDVAAAVGDVYEVAVTMETASPPPTDTRIWRIEVI